MNRTETLLNDHMDCFFDALAVTVTKIGTPLFNQLEARNDAERFTLILENSAVPAALNSRKKAHQHSEDDADFRKRMLERWALRLREYVQTYESPTPDKPHLRLIDPSDPTENK